MPIKLSAQWGKLFSAITAKGTVRPQKEYCSFNCQQAGWWTPEKKADNAFVRRLQRVAESAVQERDGYSIDDLQKRLERPKVKQRLTEIEKRWVTNCPAIV